MRDYAREQIIENYGQDALYKIENAEHKGNMLLVYADNNIFEIIGGILANHSMSIDNAVDLLDLDMDTWATSHGLENWDYDFLHLVDVE